MKKVIPSAPDTPRNDAQSAPQGIDDQSDAGGLFTGVQTAVVPVLIGHETFGIRTVADLDHLLEKKLEHELTQSCPFGGVIWPSSVSLCNWLDAPDSDAVYPRALSIRLFDEIKSRIEAPGACLELGCGVGLAGLFFAHTFGCRALLTDFEPSLETLVRQNAEVLSCAEQIDFALLDWNTGPSAPLLQFTQKSQTRVIIAADVLYETQHISAVPATAARLMKETGAEIFILADPERYCYESAQAELQGRFSQIERITLQPPPGQKAPTKIHLHFCKHPKSLQ